LGEFGPLGTRETLSLTAVDSFLAHPVAERLLVHPKRPRHVGHGALLVNDQSGRVSAELFGITATALSRDPWFYIHNLHLYLLYEVSGKWGEGHVDPSSLCGVGTHTKMISAQLTASELSNTNLRFPFETLSFIKSRSAS
jgi:hypothetical protein